MSEDFSMASLKEFLQRGLRAQAAVDAVIDSVVEQRWRELRDSGEPTAFVEQTDSGWSIRCVPCGWLSHDPKHVRQKFCANCQRFHEPFRKES